MPRYRVQDDGNMSLLPFPPLQHKKRPAKFRQRSRFHQTYAGHCPLFRKGFAATIQDARPVLEQLPDYFLPTSKGPRREAGER